MNFSSKIPFMRENTKVLPFYCLLGWDLNLWKLELCWLCVCVCVSHSVVSGSLRPHVRLLCPWDSPGKNTGVGCHSLLQGIVPTYNFLFCSLVRGAHEVRTIFIIIQSHCLPFFHCSDIFTDGTKAVVGKIVGVLAWIKALNC